MKCALRCLHYITGKHELPISPCLSYNSYAFQNFMRNVLSIKAELCQTHTTAIAYNNGTHFRTCRSPRVVDTHLQVKLIH